MFPPEVSDSGPDLLAQELAHKISDEEIESLSFAGLDIGFDYIDEIDCTGLIVTDRALISQFWEALRHAHGRHVLNRVCYFLIKLKGVTKPTDPAITLRFWPGNPADCFGPDFHEALRELSNYHARQIGRMVSEIADKITEVEIANHIQHIIHVAKPDEIKAVVQALAQLDGKAFAFTENPNDSLWIRLHLGQSEARDITLKVACSELTDLPSLPSLLWDYYLLAINWRIEQQ